VSLHAFQLALADLAASPALCARVADGSEVELAAYDLTAVERRRVAAVAGQRGMKVNCTLYRYNRISTLTAVMPGAIHLLGRDARTLADEFWAAAPADVNMRREAERFAVFVRSEMARSRLESPYLLEVMEYELLRYDVATRPRARLSAQVAADAERWPDGPLALHPLLGIARFVHDPLVLLPLIDARSPLPYADVPEGDFHLLLDCRAGIYEQRPLDRVTAHLLRDAFDPTVGVNDEAANELLAGGILVRTAPSVLALGDSDQQPHPLPNLYPSSLGRNGPLAVKDLLRQRESRAACRIE
jgi:hypothetical protein